MESLELTADQGMWYVSQYNGNFFEVGATLYGYSQLPNTVIANGQVLNRDLYPRLWEYAQSLVGAVISDLTWTGSPGYKGFFSSGNGTTTFRIPDLRSMFIRGLDLGAGVSIARNSENPGGYEDDEFKSHSHSFVPDDKPGKSDNANDRDVMVVNGNGRTIQSGNTGGLETRPKNIGLIPLIKV